MEMLTLVGTKFETTSKALNKALDGYVKAIQNGQKASEDMAKNLYTIKSKELWKDGEDFVEINGVVCETFGAVANVIGIGKQHAYKLASAYELKHDESVEERLAPFNISQVTEMVTLSATDIMVLVDEGLIVSSMTLKQIRDAVYNYKHADDEDVQGDAEGEGDVEDDGEPVDNTYKVVISGVEFVIEDIKVQKAISKVLEKNGIISVVED